MQEQTRRMEEPCVRVFFPGVSDPYEYDVGCETEFVENKLGKRHNCIGELKKRGNNKEVGTKNLQAGDYEFHIIPPQRQGK